MLQPLKFVITVFELNIIDHDRAESDKMFTYHIQWHYNRFIILDNTSYVG